MSERNRTGAGRGRNEYGSIGSAPRGRSRRRKGILGLLSALGPILYFPMMIFYLEFFFHIYMGEGIRYLPVWLFFSVSMGFFLSLFAINFSFRANRIITYVITILFSLIYGLKMFDLIYVMTGGGPGNATESFGTLMMNEMSAGRYSQSVAVNLVFTVLLVIVSVVYQKFSSRWETVL